MGQISVLRSESPSELRPYQRALSGNQAKERFIITVDGSEYQAEQHNLIGLGEVPPHAGLTVGQYLTSAGLIDGAISGLLMAFGSEGIETKLCSALSPDDERKVRIFAATADPSKALILNEPFEPISSNWRERMSEFLADFARTKNGLIVITSLSYRPDSWIDNPVIVRHQVGQSLRRTIGFGAAGSDSNQMINQLRDQIRNEATSSGAAHTQAPPQEERSKAAAMSLGAAAMVGAVDAKSPRTREQMSAVATSSSAYQKPSIFAALKAATAVLGVSGLGVWAAVALLGTHSMSPAKTPGLAQNATNSTVPSQQPNNPVPQIDRSGETRHNNPAKNVQAPDEPKRSYILDRYPEAIRVSLLDTSKGIMGYPSQADQSDPPPPRAEAPADKSGNFYKLLESAGTEKNGAPGPETSWQEPEEAGQWNAPESSEPVEYNASEEEGRREAIRQKFLDAIRAAAEQRQAEGIE